MQIGGNEKRSKVIKDNLDPVWNETFLWQGCRSKDAVTIVCKDQDPFKDAILGACEVPLSNAMAPPGVVHTFECSLFTKDRKRKAEGSITIQLLYLPRDAESKDPMPDEPDWPEAP